jgi:hypothetical protein
VVKKGAVSAFEIWLSHRKAAETQVSQALTAPFLSFYLCFTQQTNSFSTLGRYEHPYPVDD